MSADHWEWASVVTNARLVRETLAKNIFRERTRTGVSQKALAEACQVSRDTISRLERGEQEPRITTLVAFSIALNVPLSAFLKELPGEYLNKVDGADDQLDISPPV